MTKRKHEPPDVIDAPEADTVRVYMCENCGNLHLVLLDKDENVIAGATLPTEQAEDLRDNIFKALLDIDAREPLQ